MVQVRGRIGKRATQSGLRPTSRSEHGDIFRHQNRTSSTKAVHPTQISQPSEPVGLSLKQSKLIASLGQSLQDPLSTIQVCLESFAQPSNLPPTAQSDLLTVALADIAYLQFLVNELLTYFEDNQDANQKTCVIHQPTVSLQQAPHKPLAILGHELRTPLVAIKICLESLELRPTSELDQLQAPQLDYQAQMLAMALADVNRLRTLLQSFLRLSRLQQASQGYQPEPVNLTQVAEILISGLQTKQDLVPKIHIELPHKLPAVYANEEWLTEVLQQLIDNACKFTDSAGEITIRTQCSPHPGTECLGCHPSSPPSEMLTVVVADTGCGIPQQQLKAIFDCFYQVEGALRRTVNGAGIGLTICYQLVERMGGHIWAQSQGNGCGTEFCFTLPIA